MKNMQIPILATEDEMPRILNKIISSQLEKMAGEIQTLLEEMQNQLALHQFVDGVKTLATTKTKIGILQEKMLLFERSLKDFIVISVFNNNEIDDLLKLNEAENQK